MEGVAKKKRSGETRGFHEVDPPAGPRATPAADRCPCLNPGQTRHARTRRVAVRRAPALAFNKRAARPIRGPRKLCGAIRVTHDLSR